MQMANCNVITLDSDLDELCFSIDDKEDEEMVVRKPIIDPELVKQVAQIQLRRGRTLPGR